MKPQLDLRLTQKMVMTPQLQQAINLLMLNRLDLAQEMQEAVLENPLLEIVEGDEESDWAPGDEGEAPPPTMDERMDRNEPESGEEESGIDPLSNWDYSVDESLDNESYQREERTLRESDAGEFSYEKVLSQPTTLSDHLEWQLSFTDLSPGDREAASYLVGNIDEDGYLALEGGGFLRALSGVRPGAGSPDNPDSRPSGSRSALPSGMPSDPGASAGAGGRSPRKDPRSRLRRVSGHGCQGHGPEDPVDPTGGGRGSEFSEGT